MRTRARIDAIHGQIRDVFTAHGFLWENTPIGKGFPDAMVFWGQRLTLLEIKSGARAAKRTGKTADAQRAFAARFPVTRISSEQEALQVIHALKGVR